MKFDDFYDDNCKFIHENIQDIFEKYISRVSLIETYNILDLKIQIKKRIIELVSGMINDFREEAFHLDVNFDWIYEDSKCILTINLKPSCSYSVDIFKTKNFHILSRKLKIKEIFLANGKSF
jgi:hypothetical protein